ncbi:MAG: PadR family transcriptional regulator [Candidatus Asgardarchaeia archaeon]
MSILEIFPFEKKKDIIEYVILSILKKDKSHGYDLMNEIKRITGGAWKPSHSMVYPLLNDLEKRKVIEKVDEKEKDARKNIYKITDEGIKYLREKEKRMMKFYVDLLSRGYQHPIPVSFLISDYGLQAIKQLNKNEQLIILKFLRDKLSKALEKINKMIEEI